MARDTDSEEEDAPARGDDDEPESAREFVILLARDIAIAVLIVGIVLGAIFAYARVWPPMVVVESNSMQHSSSMSYLDVIDTGDLVLVQSAPYRADVVTWVEGWPKGHRTYGDYGDVVIYQPPTAPGSTPIIHRPIIYLEWNASWNASSLGGGYDAPSLMALPRSHWSATDDGGNPLAFPFNITGSLTLNDLGFRGDLTKILNFATWPRNGRGISGYATMGDHNAYSGGTFDDWIVPHSRVVGKARGELPWLGLIKLTIWRSGPCCASWGAYAPRNSWDSLALTLVLIPLGLFLADQGFVYLEDWWKGRRTRSGGHAADPEEPEEPEPGDDEPR